MNSGHLKIPPNADLKSGTLLGVISGGFRREREVHKTLARFLVPSFREWFADGADLRAAINLLGLDTPPPAFPAAKSNFVTTTISSELHGQLKSMAKTLRLPMHALVTEAVEHVIAEATRSGSPQDYVKLHT